VSLRRKPKRVDGKKLKDAIERLEKKFHPPSDWLKSWKFIAIVDQAITLNEQWASV